ncbi:hypothetical protein WJX73_007064 [Symbiochloris irregularis]|uniref:N-acetyltransferase domain-containing protein n=1 Tax=Symbiochloris irregularis TaxID=706552 RepID=A0AAW1PAM7_9CHLO
MLLLRTCSSRTFTSSPITYQTTIWTHHSSLQSCRGSARAEVTSRRAQRKLATRLRARAQQALQEPTRRQPAPKPIRDWVSRDGRWRVRLIRNDEIKEAALIQAEAFFKPKGIAPLDRLLLRAFQGEVWQLLKNKLSVAPADGYCCLVAEDAVRPAGVLGTVEVSLQSEQEELSALRSKGLEDQGYAYLTSIAVSTPWRRRGIASALLSAAERVAGRWHQNWVLLHAYDSDAASVGVYSRCGYAKLRVDPAWVGMLGGRQRVLMAKNATMAPPSNGLPVSAAISSISPGLMRIFQSQTPDM